MNIHELLKKLTRSGSSPSTTPSQSKETSRASSLHEQPQSPAAQAKYLNDPMRTSSHPDSVGYFVDPMGGRPVYHASYDVTNTGA
ncbi:hypothetical protein BCR42DRAFT_404996 [Absidia repens]|uniref:Uncharacterized protein n=1 Tax=Absidia repens TaxID=90262 RepID=A0A1X2IWW7_9FUNG|nr:hypothetical protein BCR42DRAFT_404996 [Absidia repens]